MGKMNVLGLNPDSKFLSYLENGYNYIDNQNVKNDWAEFSITYGSTNQENIHNRKWDLVDGKMDNSWITFNGKKYPEKPSFKITQFKNMEVAWTIDNLKILDINLDLQTNLDGKIRFCMTNRSPYFIGLKNHEKLVKKIHMQLCGKENECMYHNSDISKVSPIKIDTQNAFTPHQLIIQPIEFLRLKNNLVQVMITNVENFNNFCPSSTSVGLGAHFFISREVTFKKRIGQEQYEIWYSQLDIPPPDIFKGKGFAIANIIVYVLHFLGICLVILYIVYMTCVPEKWKLDSENRAYKANKFKPYTFENGSYNEVEGGEDAIETGGWSEAKKEKEGGKEIELERNSNTEDLDIGGWGSMDE